MARPGITKREVFAAANQIMAEGRDPTIEQIRQLLKTGSNSTIGGHLRDWRSTQSDVQTVALNEGLPHDLIVAMKSLWERVQAQAEERLVASNITHQQECAALQEGLEKYKANNQRWQQLFTQWTLEKEQLTSERQGLIQSVTNLEAEKADWLTKHGLHLSQLRDKQERIDELHHLHAQAQANLEHYRESAREQRLIEQQQFEQQLQLLQGENKSLREQVIMTRDKLSSSEQQLYTLQDRHTLMAKTHEQLEQKLETKVIELTECKAVKNELQLTSHHWQTQCKETQAKLDERTAQCFDLQAEAKLMSQNFTDIKATVKDLSERMKLLEHEKWLLTKENSQLEGQLKQMSKLAVT